MNTAALTGQSAWRSLRQAAATPYKRSGRFAWKFARGKLRLDPVFRHLLKDGLITPQSRVLDIGCGQGLLASLLCAASAQAQQGIWPSDWAAAPVGSRVTGIELMARDVERAQSALAGAADFVCGDMRHTPFPPVDAVVILDVLHYISVEEQDEVLKRVRDALRPGGRLLLRIGDAASWGSFRISQWVDRIVTQVRGHRVRPVFCRPLKQWTERLHALGFEVETRKMSQGTPFANVLLVARLASTATTAASGPT